MKNKILVLILSIMSIIGYAQCVPSASNPDSDGDGIADVCDLDDDNDGILDTVECPTTYIVRRVISSSVTANKPITEGTAPQIVDGEGAGGTADGPYPNWYTNVLNLPIAFSMNMQSSSTIDHIKLYGPWGFDEWIGNFTVELYNASNTLLGTENFVTPNQYTGTPIFSFTKEYTNVTRVRFTIVSSQGYSAVAPPRASLTEIVFLDLQPLSCDTDGDGIPNHLDLDSDNDGCPDSIEGGASFTSTNLVNSSMPGGNSGATSGSFNQPITQNLGNTVNTTSTSTSYGVPTVAGSGQTIGTSQTANPVLAAGTAGANQTITSGSTPTALSLAGATGSIQWQVSTNNTTFTNISGATNTTYAPGALTATRYYRAIVTSAGGCTAISNTVTINISIPCVVSATNPDSDGDGIADDCDLDDDNDGILDCVENGANPFTDVFVLNNDAIYATPLVGGPAYQVRLVPDAQSKRGQAWSKGKVDFTKDFVIPMKIYISSGPVDADGMAIVFQNQGTNASGITGQGLGARGIPNGIALEIDIFQNTCTLDAGNGGNCDPSFDHGSIRTTSGWVGTDKLAGDAQLGNGDIADNAWHNVVVTWDAATRNLSYTFDGTAVTNYTFAATGANSIETILGGTSSYFGYTASTGLNNSEHRIGFDFPCDLPLFRDTDGDGIPDYLDLDSDNDGCPDAIEGGASFTSANLVNSSMPGGNSGATSGAFNQPITQNLGNTVNTTSTSTSYGVPTVAGSGQTIGTSQTANPVLAAGTAGANQTISTGSTPTALALTGATGSIQWQVSTDNTTFNNISGATATTYAPGALTATRYYRAIVTSAGGCTAISNTVTITVTTCTVNSLKPTVSSPLANSCPANFVDLNGAFTSTLPAGAELQWFSNNTHSGTPFTSVQVSQATSGTYYAFFYDAINNCYSNASDPVTVNIIPCCPTFTAYSTTGWKAKVYDAPAGTDAWTQISSSTTFPTTSYSQVATFDYNVKAGTNDAFSIDFQTRATGLTPSNPQIQNYVGTQIYNDPAWPLGDPRTNEDYAVLFSKTVVSGEAGTYKFGLTYGDDHVFIYKNGVKITQIDNAYYLFPFPNFANINLAVGDVISVLMVEEYEFNTEVKIFSDKTPNVQNIANTCPSTTANLNDAFLGGTAPGVSLLWFNNNSHTGTPLTATEIANAAAGTYYAFYYNGSGCYSPASNAVTVTINNCVCYKDPVNNGSGTETKMGITLLKRAGNNDPDNWPMIRKSGHLALESNKQGFVVTRIAKANLGNITNPQEGMMVYDTTDKCLKIYSDNVWTCFSTPTCP